MSNQKQKTTNLMLLFTHSIVFFWVIDFMETKKKLKNTPMDKIPFQISESFLQRSKLNRLKIQKMSMKRREIQNKAFIF